ncbi:MAG: LuxR C-terminal-related transcriptional regulator [Paracoccus sp. (in: a-proteobacteria)]|uniref:helix-turn-helix transcriptional regulator n=1 Tax=Paracoccus sp. TaxID=267 RepID=UPI0026DEEF12|nr:LuxR C-terminal-related transcriptional regulator [Paracoccus sp. (in: a-proteobacteria)]MDO5613990.1 LuxR C-terminal-related transcriptional regulator [Paracoccus sp. (in: a-proteobacteria)]
MTADHMQDIKTRIIVTNANPAYQDDMRHIIRQLNPGADIVIMTAPPSPESPQTTTPDNPLQRLSVRQKTVLKLIVEGRTNKDIARDLAISPSTVRVHVSAVLRVLGVSSRTAAAVMAAGAMTTAAARIAAE